MISTVLPSETRRFEHVEKFFDVVEVKAGGRLVENIQGAAGLAARKFAREFRALRFAAGKGGGGLAELDIAEAHIDERLEFLLDCGNVFESFQGFLDGQIEKVRNGEALVADGECLRVVALAAAHLAGDVHVGEEIHFDAALSVALARFAAATLDVETETTRTIASFARFRKHRVEFADRSEHAGVGGGIRARRASDGRLIDLNDFVDVLDSGDRAVRAGLFHRAIELGSQCAVENIVDERGLSGAGHAGDDGQQARAEMRRQYF